MVDLFSSLSHVVAFRDTKTTTRNVICHVRYFFSRVRTLVIYLSINGPQAGFLWQKAADVLEKRSRRSKELNIANYNKHTRPLPPIVDGNHVLIRPPISKLWWTHKVIAEVGIHRDFLIKTPAVWIQVFRGGE
jgi:hypothetical protein